MYSDKPLNMFYSEPDPDRWLPYDRYPRKIIRRLVHGKARIGGVQMVAVNLLKGLEKSGVKYRFNNYSYIKKHPDEISCIIGKPDVLFQKKWANPIIFGAGVFSHPIEHPDFFEKYPNVKRFLVPGEWMRKMFEPYYGDKVVSWPAGIDTDEWQPANTTIESDFLIYDKIFWDYEIFEKDLLDPIKHIFEQRGLTFERIQYGHYTPEMLKDKLKRSKAVLFLCRSESQGFAYQQVLSTNTPVLAWDQGGYWPDPHYYPDKVKYKPVNSVPYWDERCGIKFTGIDDFEQSLDSFLANLSNFKPRDYILENLTLEKCAQKYLDIYHQVERELA